ncbi:MAG: toxin Y4kP [Nitrospirae bacterium GWC2_42_7]|nr:MAG: toxin Y4kP [Nitrospirae bacterium GWC2_42_7]
MKIKWFLDAILDLIEIRDFIASDKPLASNEISARIKKSVEILKENPGIGRPGRVPNTRELIITGTPYIVPYRVRRNVIEILRVLHGAMKWPDKF